MSAREARVASIRNGHVVARSPLARSDCDTEAQAATIFHEAFANLVFDARVQTTERNIKACDLRNLAVMNFVAAAVYSSD